MYFQRQWRRSKDSTRVRSCFGSTDPILWIVFMFYTSWTGSTVQLFIINRVSLAFHSWEHLYHYLIDRNTIGSRPIRNWISLPSLFFIYFFFFWSWKRTYQFSLKISSFNNSCRSGNFVSLLCIGKSKKKKFQICFDRINLDLYPGEL